MNNLLNNVLIDDLERLDNGFLRVCDAVGRTLGAEGKLSVMEHPNPEMPCIISKDGVSVSNHIRFADKVSNFGATLAKQAALKTLERAGDATSTTLVLSQAFLRNFPDRSKYNKTVERGLQKGYDEAILQLKKLSKPVDSKILGQIATISSNNDEKLGNLIIDAFDKVGYNGIVEIRKDKNTNETKLDVFQGMKIEKGYSSPMFINNESSIQWENEDVLVAVCESWVSDNNIKIFVRDNRYKADGVTLQPILLVLEKADDIAFLMDLERFAKQKLYNICMISTPDVEKFKKLTHLSDIATYTGAEIYQATDEPTTIKAGKADSVVVNAETTAIIQKRANEETVELISTLKEQLPSTNDEQFLRKRIQRLEGTSVIIRVGGFTDAELDERHDRIDDAVRSVKSSLQEGYICGGGSTLVYISSKMNKKFKNSDEQLGYDLIKEVLKAPMKQIVANANRTNNIEEYLSVASKKYGRGYNAKSDKVSNLLKDGVVDSNKSIIVALENSKSIAEKLLSLSVVVHFTN